MNSASPIINIFIYLILKLFFFFFIKQIHIIIPLSVKFVSGE
jgi:hypothetical protein